MIAALIMALAVTATATSASVRLDAVRETYAQLAAAARARPPAASGTSDAIDDMLDTGSASLQSLTNVPSEAALADIEARAALDAQLVPALLDERVPPVDAHAGAHIGIVTVHGTALPFAYWVPAGYDPRAPGPLLILVHGRDEPPTDLIARRFFQRLADRDDAIVLAPGGDRRNGDDVPAAAHAMEQLLARGLAWDHRRRYAGGFSDGVAAAFHLIATDGEPCAGFLGIAGFLARPDDFPVTLRLSHEGAYLVVAAHDEIVGTGSVRSTVRRLRAAHVFARYYEVADARHNLPSLEPAIAQAWTDLFAGVTTISPDGLGEVTD